MLGNDQQRKRASIIFITFLDGVGAATCAAEKVNRLVKYQNDQETGSWPASVGENGQTVADGAHLMWINSLLLCQNGG